MALALLRSLDMKTKGLIRSLNRSATASRKLRPVEAAVGRLPEPSACERCGAIFAKRVWRQRRRITGAVLATAHWTTCPACQGARLRGRGCVRIRGSYVAIHEAAIRRRITNVATRAAHTQPQRRVRAIEAQDDGLDVRTTSQELAHRIARELEKAFGGRSTYAWTDDGALLATWRR